MRKCELWIAMLTLKDRCFVQGILHVNLVLDEHILAEVRRKVFCALYTYNEVDAAIEKVFRSVRDVFLRYVLIAIGVNWDNVDFELAVILIVASDQVHCDRVIDQVSQTLHPEVALANQSRLSLVSERIGTPTLECAFLLICGKQVSHFHQTVVELGTSPNILLIRVNVVNFDLDIILLLTSRES
jgi:hypothetical protein